MEVELILFRLWTDPDLLLILLTIPENTVALLHESAKILIFTIFMKFWGDSVMNGEACCDSDLFRVHFH